MGYDPGIHHRRSIRLKGFDYSSEGAYFVTVCAQGRESLFGEIVDRAVVLNDAGRMSEDVWLALTERYPQIELDEYIVMPNHFHGIIVIKNEIDHVGAIHELPLPIGESPQNEIIMQKNRRNMSLPKIIGYFKMNSAKGINTLRKMQGVPVWQRNYHERIIRDEAELAVTRKYITDNPIKWAEDTENPSNVP